MDTYFEQAVALMGGQTRAAEKLGVKQGHVWHWLKRPGRCPAEQVIPVCSHIGYAITPHQLRPDIYPFPLDGIPSRQTCGAA